MLKVKQTPPTPLFMGIYEAAKYCRVSYRLFRQAVDEGKIPYVKFGEQVFRFSREALDDYIRYGGNQTERKGGKR